MAALGFTVVVAWEITPGRDVGLAHPGGGRPQHDAYPHQTASSPRRDGRLHELSNGDDRQDDRIPGRKIAANRVLRGDANGGGDLIDRRGFVPPALRRDRGRHGSSISRSCFSAITPDRSKGLKSPARAGGHDDASGPTRPAVCGVGAATSIICWPGRVICTTICLKRASSSSSHPGPRGPLRGRAGKRAALERAGGFSLLALFSLANRYPLLKGRGKRDIPHVICVRPTVKA